MRVPVAIPICIIDTVRHGIHTRPMAVIYGVDTDKPLTALMVRDALVTCFFEAHCRDTGLELNDNETGKTYCESLIRDAFAKAKADFEHPDKDGLCRVIAQLKDFSVKFRDPSVIERHAREIMLLVDRLS